MQKLGAERNIRHPLAQPDVVQIRTKRDCDLIKTCISVPSSTRMEVMPSCVHVFGAMSGVSKEQWLRVQAWGFPGGAAVGSPPANAGDTGSCPGPGGSHVPRSGWAREPQLLSLRVWSLCSATREAAIVRGPRTAMRSGPRLPQLEKALAQKRGPNTDINK